MLLLLLPWIKTAYFRACVLIVCLLLTLIEYYEYGYENVLKRGIKLGM